MERKHAERLPCYSQPCPFNYSHLAFRETEPWLEMFRFCRLETTEKISGLALKVLEQSDGLDGETLEIFALFDSEISKAREEAREKAKQSRPVRV